MAFSEDICSQLCQGYFRDHRFKSECSLPWRVCCTVRIRLEGRLSCMPVLAFAPPQQLQAAFLQDAKFFLPVCR